MSSHLATYAVTYFLLISFYSTRNLSKQKVPAKVSSVIKLTNEPIGAPPGTSEKLRHWLVLSHGKCNFPLALHEPGASS